MMDQEYLKNIYWNYIFVSGKIANLLSYSEFDILVPILIPVIISLVGKSTKYLIEKHPMTLRNCYLDTPKISVDWSVGN